MQTNMYLVGSGTPAYLRVVCENAKPDKPQVYAAALKKYFWPTFEDQLKKGVVNYVSVDAQYVNNMAPSTRCVVINFPNAESVDKWAAAINATRDKMTDADRDAYTGSMVTDSGRDFMARITHFGAVHD